jgi:hypothetical protein
MPAKFERCVKDVKAKAGKAKNPYAICNASMKRGKKKKTR